MFIILRSLFFLNFYIQSKIRIFSFFLRGINISTNVKIDKNVSLYLTSPFYKSRKGKIIIKKKSLLSQDFICHAYGGNVIIGENTFIGPSVIIYGHGNVTIGDNCLIAMGCKIISSNHSYALGTKIARQKNILSPVIIGNDVWLGADVKVLAGVTIGNGSVVASGSVVTKSLPENSISAGIPAKIIKYRE